MEQLYITAILTVVTAVLWWPRRSVSPFRWRWSIALIAVFISLADFTYFYALTVEGSMLSVISLVRRSSVVVSFLCGALLFREKNLRSKALDLVLLLIGLAFLLLGTL